MESGANTPVSTVSAQQGSSPGASHHGSSPGTSQPIPGSSGAANNAGALSSTNSSTSRSSTPRSPVQTSASAAVAAAQQQVCTAGGVDAWGEGVEVVTHTRGPYALIWYQLHGECRYPSSTYYWFCICHFYDWGWVGRLSTHPPPIIKMAPGLIPLQYLLLVLYNVQV